MPASQFLTRTTRPSRPITEEMYGKAYMIQQYVLPEKVRDYIEEHVTVE